jgi:signal transduction histidine kinase
VTALVDRARRYGVDALAVALCVATVIEVWGAPLPGSQPTLTVAALFATLPLLFRRRAPLGASLAVFATLVVTALLEPTALYDSSFFFFGALLATWSVAERNPNRQGVVGYAAAIATVIFVASRFPDGGADDVVWISAFFTFAWLAGFAVGHRAQQAREAEERLGRAEERRRLEAETAVADERARIARELHDVVAHSISVMTVQAAGVRRLLGDGQEREREALTAIEDTGREALTEMRRLLGILRGADEDADLAQQARDAGLPVEVSIEGDPVDVPAGLDLSAYRVVQEALTNALRHAGPATAKVVVRYEPDVLALEIENDGNAASDGERQGLAGMRERVAFYGGTLDAGPRPGGRGYVVRARIPLRQAAWR